jgi:uncharacterized protein (DUF608 family)
MRGTRYSHERPQTVGHPLGGIGTGSVELCTDGRLKDWELFNNGLWAGDKDNKQPRMLPEDAACCLAWRDDDGPGLIRWLVHGDGQDSAASESHRYGASYTQAYSRPIARIRSGGRYPIAEQSFDDPALPLDIQLEAFTPFVPGDEATSGLPLAWFCYRVRNTGTRTGTLSLAWSLRNCCGWDQGAVHLKHELQHSDHGRLIVMSAEDLQPKAASTGSMALFCSDPDASHLLAWTDGRGLAGFDNADTPAYQQFVHALRHDAVLSSAEHTWSRHVQAPAAGIAGCCTNPRIAQLRPWRASLASTVSLAPGEERLIRFGFAWHFPHHHYFKNPDYGIGHHYQSRFADAAAVAVHGLQHQTEHEQQTRRFHALFDDSSLPDWLLEDCCAQLTSLPEASWWGENDDFGQWEGKGCCQVILADRTHWSSFQPLIFFPELYRRMSRRLANSKQAVGLLAERIEERKNRTQSKKGAFGGWFAQRYQHCGYQAEDFSPTQLWLEGGALMLLRDYRWTNDSELLQAWWPQVKAGIERGIAADLDDDGLPDGAVDFQTYDHWFLPRKNCYRISMWLAELRAGEALADLLQEPASAKTFRQQRQRATDSLERLLWNGRSYDLAWDELKNSRDTGVLADQVSGQLYPRLLDLGPVHDPERTRSSLRQVLEANLGRESGLVNGADPDGREDWTYFARYSRDGSDEQHAGQWPTPWTGTEYYVAATMLSEGLIEEGLAVLRDVHDRHVAFGQVNSHIECGEHYFRAHVIWACLHALQGLHYDNTIAELAIAPQHAPAQHRSPLLLPGAYGIIEQQRHATWQRNRLHIAKGQLELQRLRLQVTGTVERVERDDDAISWDQQGNDLVITFLTPTVLKTEDLTITVHLLAD